MDWVHLHVQIMLMCSCSHYRLCRLSGQPYKDNKRFQTRIQVDCVEGYKGYVFFFPSFRAFPFLNIVLTCVKKLEHSESPQARSLWPTQRAENVPSVATFPAQENGDTLIVTECKNSWNRWVWASFLHTPYSIKTMLFLSTNQCKVYRA